MNIQDNQGSTPLHITSSSGDFDSVQLLFEQDAEVLAWDNEGSTQVLIRNGAAVNVRDNKKLTPLHSRISQGNLTVIKPLIQYGADVDARDNKDSSPGHLALANGSFNIAEVLIQRGANVTVQDNESSTYFHLALVNGNFNAVELLL